MDFKEYCGNIMEEQAERNERVLRHFFCRINYKGIVGYDNNLSERVFTVWTNRPGILIGKGGQNVEILKEVIKEEFDKDYDVIFKEIKGEMLVAL